MIKEEKLLFPRIFPIVLAIFVIDVVNFVYKMNKINPFNSGLTGYSVVESFGEMYSSLPMTSKVLLWVQICALVLLLLYIMFRDKGITEDKKELSTINLSESSRPSETDLDVLYKLLKEKGKLRISTIAKAFKIDSSLAMEWAKTMEEGKLATIDYPRFSGPILRIPKPKIKQK